MISVLNALLFGGTTMKKIKKTLSLILALVIVLSLVPVGTVVAVAERVLKILVEPTLVFQNVYFFYEDRAIVYKSDGKPAIVNTRGGIVVNLDQFDYAYGFIDGFATVGMGSGWIEGDYYGYWSSMKYGIIDTSGKVIVPTIYDEINFFSEGLARVGIGTNWQTRTYGFIDKTGKVVVPITYDYADSFSEGLARVGMGDWGTPGTPSTMKFGFVNSVGNVVIPITYDSAGSFTEGLVYVGVGADWQTRKFGFINTVGNVVIPITYDSVGSFSEGLARVGIGNIGSGLGSPSSTMKFGFVNTVGNVIIPIIYDSAGSFSEGLALVGVGADWATRKFGFINTIGNVVVPITYDDADHFSEGLARVGLGTWGTPGTMGTMKYGFINITGNIVVPIIYNSAGSFFEGLVSVGVGADWETIKWGLINTDGDILLPIEYDRMSSLWSLSQSEGYFCISKNGLFGIALYRDSQTWLPLLSYNRFNDVPDSNWQNAAVSWADRNNITTGSPAGSDTFKPNDAVTRAEFVTFFHRIYGSPSAPRATFSDMPANTAFQNAISWAFAKGITTGSPAGSNTFMPNDNITREQIAAMLYRYIGGGVPAPDSLGGYTDQNRISTWTGAREAVNWAVYHGIMGVNVTELNPGGNATRAEAVTMLYRVVEIFKITAP